MVLLQRSAVQRKQNPNLQGTPSAERSSETVCTSLSDKYQSSINYHINQQQNKTIRLSTVAGQITQGGLHHGMNLKTCAVETGFLNIFQIHFKLGEIKQRNCCKLLIYGILNEAVRSSELDTISRETASVKLPPPFLLFFTFSYTLSNSHILPTVVAGVKVVFQIRIQDSPYSACDRICVHISIADCTFHCLNLDWPPATYEHLM